MTGYSTFRLLADAFADNGFPTQAIDWLRENCGAERIVLCGFRFGATLAATVAASNANVAGLILFAPITRARSYVRQLLVETSQCDDGYIDAGRFRPKELLVGGSSAGQSHVSAE